MEEAECSACGSKELIEYSAIWHDGSSYQVKSCIWHAPLEIINLGEFRWLKDINQQTA
jgi:hypothetical protein